MSNTIGVLGGRLSLSVETFEYKGELRLKRSLTVDRVLALPKPKKSKPRADRPATKRWTPLFEMERPAEDGRAPLDDSLPF